MHNVGEEIGLLISKLPPRLYDGKVTLETVSRAAYGYDQMIVVFGVLGIKIKFKKVTFAAERRD